MMPRTGKSKWLVAMYLYTAIGAGILGLALLAVPDIVLTLLGMPPQDPPVLGMVGSVYLAFGALSLLGVRAPRLFVPILLLQLTYKTVWLVFVFLPALITGQAPAYTILLAVVFATYVAGDLIAIPFRDLLAEDAGKG